MAKKIRIGWDISHQEFTIEDHYYYSYLKTKIRESGAAVSEFTAFAELGKYDVVVINYPEKPFTKAEVKLVESYLLEGKKVIVTGYYNNEDKVAECVNSLVSSFGVTMRDDKVRDKSNNDNEDDLLIVTSRVLSYEKGVKKVMLPCSSSISMEDNDVKPLIYKEKATSRSRSEKILAAVKTVGGGALIVLGTCVFWDNFAIKKYSNLKFSLNLLVG